jgi:predicted MPP superfamily phosphohydrolase
MEVALLAFALFGHAVIWVAVVNRVHSTRIGPRYGRRISLVCFALMTIIPVAFGVWLFRSRWEVVAGPVGFRVPWPVAVYLFLCCVAAVLAISGWLGRRVFHRPPDVLRHHRTRLVDLARLATPATAEDQQRRVLLRLPGNETFTLDVAERGIDIPRLHRDLDGLSIVHLSDLHFTGKVTKGYFHEVVRLANELEPDIVAITGDLADSKDRLEWAPETLCGLRARHGAYFVLGNHDVKVDHGRLREMLGQCGLVHLGGRLMTLSVRGQPVVLAGDERPWFSSEPDFAGAPPSGSDGCPLRILLTHTPDQLEWARSQDVDLMLAGHLHGGQIRLPLVGPIFSPSRLGVKYACGLFHAPPTIMHVTRGVSGEYPIRMNCPPEIVRLVLHADSVKAS